jgi:stage V sporulation protein G
MEITDIRMNLLDNAGGVKAIGSFSLDNAFAVRGMRVMEDKKGRNFVAFPSRERANGEYEDIAFPLSKEFYHEITDAIMKEFHRKQEEVAAQAQDKSQSQDESHSQEQAPTEDAAKPRKGHAR